MKNVDLKQRRDGSWGVWIDAVFRGRVWRKNRKWYCTGDKKPYELRRYAITALKSKLGY
jgi:hypothetical protein